MTLAQQTRAARTDAFCEIRKELKHDAHTLEGLAGDLRFVASHAPKEQARRLRAMALDLDSLAQDFTNELKGLN